MPNWIETNLKPGDPGNLTRPFECKFQARAQQYLSFHDACDYTAKVIAQNYSNLYLALSGGLDSLCVANVLKRNKIDFVPVIIDVQNKLLDQDVWYAYQWCDQNNVSPMIYQVDQNMYDLINKKLLRYVINNHTYASPIYISCFITEIIDPNGCLITGDGEPFHVPSHYHDICSDFIELYEGCYYLPLTFGDRHPGGFFNHTPELLWSMVKWADLSLNTQQIKADLYQLPFRPKCLIMHSGWGKYRHITDRYQKTDNLQLHRISRDQFLELIG